MIPSLVVDDLRSSLVEYLSSSFALADDDVRDALSQFLTDESDGIFRGPFLRVRTPFVAVDDEWASPLDWLPDNFRPFDHQARAFERLSTNDHDAQPTLVTTGTGSGKTECFLMPLLDHCAREKAANRPGIKALILYPMNALASDQAGRIARLLAEDKRLAGLTAGLYIGENGTHTSMGADHLIDRREALRDDPPDILLTNYKMLDFLLLRREDRNLWACNEPDTLRFVVLDEFHTYDGAQGTDVAMLLRRLGATLSMATDEHPLGSAVPVATSATLGSGTGALDALRAFASKVFGTEFPPESIIGESRQTVEQACRPLQPLPVPDLDELFALAEDDFESLAALFCTHPTSAPPDWSDPVQLGEVLLGHSLTRSVLAAVGEQPRTWSDTVAEVVRRAPEWETALATDPRRVHEALGRFLALLSIARRNEGGRVRPLFPIEVQLWVREVSRLLRRVDSVPAFRWKDSAAAEPDDEAPPLPGSELPGVFCRRCGLSGWMALQSELGGQMLVSSSSIYQAAIIRSPRIRTMLRAAPADPAARWYDPSARRLGKVEADVGVGSVPVHATETEDDAKANRCPACGELDSIRFLGLAVASLASVSINTMFGSPHLEEEERKLLAFTDSVQDASHRASFFAGRTHRINLRSLMARIIVERGDLPLSDLGDELWANAETDRDRFGLVPPDLLRHPKVRTTWTPERDRAGENILRSRLGFEADLEFGLRSRVGRTLELSRAVAATVDVADLDGVVALIAEHLRSISGDATPEAVARLGIYTRGLIERLRLRGGVHHPLLEPYVTDNGKQWHVWGGRPDGLPPFTPGQGRPIFATTSPTGDFDSLSALGTTPTWAVDWAVRCLGVAPQIARDLNVAAFALLSAETDSIIETRTPNGRVYGVARDAIRIFDLTDDQTLLAGGSGLRCGLCGNRHAAPQQLAESWLGTPCLRYRCTGSYVVDRPDPAGYYRRLYRSGVTRRVVTGEHTGLLNRADREELELAFKAGTAPDAPNVLTATPTLEMGIDIGDLSAVMLTSVPRNPASYIQRVGRAGRATGNALVMTFVRGDSHGLYYLADPEAMIAGDVRPPDCFLDAEEILERQFVAYLVDRMADLTVESPPIHNQISVTMRDGLDPSGLLRRIADASMLEPGHATAFLRLFVDHLRAASRDHIVEFAAAGIELKLKDAIDSWRDFDLELGRRRSRITDTIKKLEAAGEPSEDDQAELASLLGQRRAILGLQREHGNEYTLSALERLGVLPNYNLVDDSATLNASTWSRAETGEYEVTSIEVKRPARLALREFAPGNSFYTGGHRHVIDALEIGSSEQPLYETWRLCPDCGFGSIETEGSPPAWCNRCGSRSIADAGSLHQMLRLRSALSSGSEESTRVYDEDDDRRREQYDVITTVDVDPSTVSGPWRLLDRVFGAELAGATHLRTINLGFSEQRGEPLPIAGADRHVTRFSVCRHCGAVKEARDDSKGTRPERLHQGWCKRRSSNRKPQWDTIVLFHQLTTEAVRLLLPVSMFEVEERLASFTAALLLGLRADFGGDPDHLEVARTDLPNRGGQGRRRFLVLYDRVPGGTGYLARLAEPDRLRQILEAARDAIAHCPCQREGRAACHRCLLGVVDRRDYEIVRRDLALELLDDLLSGWEPNALEEGTLDGIDIGEVEESELERRFKVALTDWANQPGNQSATLQPVPGSGRREAFDLRITFNGRTMRYRIDEQEGLGTTPNTIPDFVIRREDEPGRPIAVYLDGYQFHASADINNIARDARQRAGIRNSGRLVWNITWDDVEAFHKAVTADPPRSVPLLSLLTGPARIATQKAQEAKSPGSAIGVDSLNQNPIELLLDYLARPDDDRWREAAQSAAGALFSVSSQRCIGAGSDATREVIHAALTGIPTPWPEPHPTSPVAAIARYETAGDLSLVLAVDLAATQAERWTVVAAMPDDADSVQSTEHRRRWGDWLRWANVLQFLDGPGSEVVIAATSAAADTDLSALWLLDGAIDAPDVLEPAGDATVATSPMLGSINESAQRPISATMAEELDFVSSDVRGVVAEVLGRGAPDFVAGWEAPDGTPLDAAWPDLRVAVIPNGSTAPALAGWAIRSAKDWTANDLLLALEEASV